MLDCDARGPANEAVGVPELWPRDLDRAFVGLMKRLELVALGALGFAAGRRWRWRGALVARVRDAIEAALDLAPADCEVHRAIRRMDDGVGEGEGSAGEEFLLRGGVAGALRLEVNGVEFAPAPIEAEE